MARMAESKNGETRFQRLLGHRNEIMESWTKLSEVFDQGLLSIDLKEQVRRTLAQGNGCEYCQAKGKPQPDTYDEKTAVAVGFADVFLRLGGTIPDAVYRRLNETFNVEEQVELCAYMTFTTASQQFGALMKIEPL